MCGLGKLFTALLLRLKSKRRPAWSLIHVDIATVQIKLLVHFGIFVGSFQRAIFQLLQKRNVLRPFSSKLDARTKMSTVWHFSRKTNDFSFQVNWLNIWGGGGRRQRYGEGWGSPLTFHLLQKSSPLHWLFFPFSSSPLLVCFHPLSVIHTKPRTESSKFNKLQPSCKTCIHKLFDLVSSRFSFTLRPFLLGDFDVKKRRS